MDEFLNKMIDKSVWANLTNNWVIKITKVRRVTVNWSLHIQHEDKDVQCMQMCHDPEPLYQGRGAVTPSDGNVAPTSSWSLWKLMKKVAYFLQTTMPGDFLTCKLPYRLLPLPQILTRMGPWFAMKFGTSNSSILCISLCCRNSTWTLTSHSYSLLLLLLLRCPSPALSSVRGIGSQTSQVQNNPSHDNQTFETWEGAESSFIIIA